MQEDLHKLLEQNLKDIQLPAEIGWWPPAVAWWVLVGVLLCALLVVIISFYRYRAQNTYRRVALNRLNNAYKQWQKDSNEKQYIRVANELLRRCVLHQQSNQTLAGTSGNAWAAVLNQLAKQQLSSHTVNAIITQAYQRTPQIDVGAVHPELTHWLKYHQRVINEPSPTTELVENTHV